MNTAEIDELFRSLARPLWIVTAADGSRQGGLLATWVMPCSLDAERPMLLAALAVSHFTTKLVQASGSFVAHLVGQDRLRQALDFALRSGHSIDKLAGSEWSAGVTGAPRLEGMNAWFECRVVDTHHTGDRYYFWATVVDGQRSVSAPAATDHDLFAFATPEERQLLRANLLADIELLRPASLAWLHEKLADK